MQKLILISITTYLVFVLDSSLTPLLSIAGCKPHFALASLVAIATRLRGARGVLLAGVWGLLSDSLAEGHLGPGLACFALAAHAVQQCAARWGLRSPLALAAATFVTAWAMLAVSEGLRLLDAGHTPEFLSLATWAAGSACYTAFLAGALGLALRLVTGRQRDSEGSAPSVSNRWRMLTN